MNTSRMALIVLVVLLIIYPLSIGPVTRYHLGNNPKEYKAYSSAIDFLYKPLWLLNHVPGCETTVQRYAMLWLSQEAIESYGLRTNGRALHGWH